MRCWWQNGTGSHHHEMPGPPVKLNESIQQPTQQQCLHSVKFGQHHSQSAKRISVDAFQVPFQTFEASEAALWEISSLRAVQVRQRPGFLSIFGVLGQKALMCCGQVPRKWLQGRDGRGAREARARSERGAGEERARRGQGNNKNNNKNNNNNKTRTRTTTTTTTTSTATTTTTTTTATRTNPFWPTGNDSTTSQKTTPTRKTFVQQQQKQQQQQQQQEQEQEQSQVTESKRHRTKTMKNQYLSRGSGGSGQGCSDSSKNTQPQFVFSGDFVARNRFRWVQHKPDYVGPHRNPIPKSTTKNNIATTTFNNNSSNNNKNKNPRTKPSHWGQRVLHGPRPWRPQWPQ